MTDPKILIDREALDQFCAVVTEAMDYLSSNYPEIVERVVVSMNEVRGTTAPILKPVCPLPDSDCGVQFWITGQEWNGDPGIVGMFDFKRQQFGDGSDWWDPSQVSDWNTC